MIPLLLSSPAIEEGDVGKGEPLFAERPGSIN